MRYARYTIRTQQNTRYSATQMQDTQDTHIYKIHRYTVHKIHEANHTVYIDTWYTRYM